MEKENKMGTMPVGRLLITMSLPMIISMLIQALYNVVDSIFVAQFSDNALAAVTYAFPAQNLMIGLATGIGVGMNSLLSKSLGEKNNDRANRAAENGVFLALAGYVIFLIFGLLFSGTFIAFQTDTAEIIDFGRSYMMICCCMSFGIFGEIIFERIMQSTGKTIYTMITQGTGAIINIILDPILIFGYFGLPSLGVTGAALATVIGQIISFILAVILNHCCNKEVRLNFRTFKPNGEFIGKICAVGIPSVIMVGIGSVMQTAMNKILNGFSDVAVSVFGAYFKLQSFVFMPIFGMNNGVIPIIAYNYGAGKRRRMMKTLRFACIIAVGFMLVGLFLMQIIPGKLLMLFNANDEMLKIGIPALRTISLSFIFAAFSIIIVSSFQALGHGINAMLISMARQLIVLIPAAYLFSLSGNIDRVWLAFPLAEVLSVSLCIIMFLNIYKKVISKIPE